MHSHMLFGFLSIKDMRYTVDMKKIRFIKTKVFLSLLTFLLAGGLVFVIFIVEKRKDINKQRNNLRSAQADAQLYKEEYIGSIQELKREYEVSMKNAKQEYEKLLAEQAVIVAQHTEKVPVGTTVANTGSESTPTTKTVTVQKKVSKPTSKRSTKSS